MQQFYLEAGTASLLGSFGPLILIFVVFYFILIRPQKKKEQQTQAMRSSVEVGDEIITIGGIVGLVVSVKDDTLVIETGNDRSKLRIARWAVQTNNTPKQQAAAAASAEGGEAPKKGLFGRKKKEEVE